MGLIFSMDDALMMEIVFYFIIFFNLLIVLFVITSKIKYNIFTLIIANLAFFLQHFFVILTINTIYSFAFFVNLFDIIANVLYAVTLLKIYNLKIHRTYIAVMLAIISVLLFVIIQVNYLHSLLRFVTNVTIALVYAYTLLRLFNAKKSKKINPSKFLITIVIVAIILKTTIGIVRLYSSSYEVSIDSIKASVVVFTFLSLLLAISLNIATLFGQYDKIYDQLNQSSSIDFLTKVYNRKFMYQKINDWIIKEKDFLVILIDINGFKKINDTYGHLEGDRILIEFANKLAKSTDIIDYVGRFGGDEFLIASKLDRPNRTFDQVKNVIELMTHDIVVSNHQSITVSGGAYLSNQKEPLTSIDAMIHHMDILLYKNKQVHENKITYHK